MGKKLLSTGVHRTIYIYCKKNFNGNLEIFSDDSDKSDKESSNKSDKEYNKTKYHESVFSRKANLHEYFFE